MKIVDKDEKRFEKEEYRLQKNGRVWKHIKGDKGEIGKKFKGKKEKIGKGRTR